MHVDSAQYWDLFAYKVHSVLHVHGVLWRANSRRQPWLNSVLNLAASYEVIVQLSALVARRHVLTAVVFHVPGELPGENKT